MLQHQYPGHCHLFKRMTIDAQKTLQGCVGWKFPQFLTIPLAVTRPWMLVRGVLELDGRQE